MKAAIVCAFRKEETDLQATIESAIESTQAKKGSNTWQVIQVEDQKRQGPGKTRHRGIEAAKDCDVIILIDAHMRFQGDVLRALAARIRETGGLAVPFCHHNPITAFSGQFDADTGQDLRLISTTQQGAPPEPARRFGAAEHFYAGARIVLRTQDKGQRKMLDAKWARATTPGPRAAVMGACYGFRRDWYYETGQPLAILTGWGGDEQALSIAAWYSGHTPEVIDGHVAHRYRARPPWPVAFEDTQASRFSQQALLEAVVSDPADKAELAAWCGWTTGARGPAIERFRKALLQQPRGWAQFKREACEALEIDGQPCQEPPAAPGPAPASAPKPSRTPAPVVQGAAITCPHHDCRKANQVAAFQVLNTYPNGRRRRLCPACGKPFIELPVA